MTVYFPGYVVGDYHLTKDEVMLTIRTSDGSPITYQAAYDGVRALLEEAFETIEAPVAPVTEEDIKRDTELN